MILLLLISAAQALSLGQASLQPSHAVRLTRSSNAWDDNTLMLVVGGSVAAVLLIVISLALCFPVKRKPEPTFFEYSTSWIPSPW